MTMSSRREGSSDLCTFDNIDASHCRDFQSADSFAPVRDTGSFQTHWIASGVSDGTARVGNNTTLAVMTALSHLMDDTPVLSLSGCLVSETVKVKRVSVR